MSKCAACGKHVHVVCGTCGGAVHPDGTCYCKRTQATLDGAAVVVTYRGRAPRIASAVSA